jgi:hypothetical protein
VIPCGSNKRWPSKSVSWLAGILMAVPIGCLCAGSHGAPAAMASPAQSPAASSPAAGITVTGIAGGTVRVAVVEMGGQSFIVGVGDRIRDFTVKAISVNEVVLGRGNQTFRLPLARGSTPPTAAVGAPPAVAIPAAAVPAAPVATSVVPSPPPAVQPTAAPAVPQPPTVPVRSLELGTPGYPQQTAVPVLAVLLIPAPPTPSAIPLGTTLYTPSGTSVYGFTTAPITTQSAVTVGGVSVLPVASNQLQPDAQLLPPGTTLYTPSGTSLYGIATAPITTQSTMTLRGATGLPVASNQAQSVEQVLPWPTYRVELAPISDQPRANAIADRLAQVGFGAKVEATTPGQYTVKLTPPPQSTVGQGLAVLKSVGVDLPIRIELVP